MDGSLSAVVWCRLDQLPLLQEVVRLAPARVTRAGSPESGRSAQVAAAFGAAPVDDLRALLATSERCVALVGDASGFGRGGPAQWGAESDVLHAARQRSVRVVTLEPIPGSLLELGGAIGGEEALPPVFIGDPDEFAGAPADTPDPPSLPDLAPRSRHSPGALDAAELLASGAIGDVRAASLSVMGPPALGGLGARMLDALDLLAMFMGEPEVIDAAFSAPAGGAGVHVQAGDSLQGLHGTLTAHARFVGGRGAVLVASDRAPRLDLRATVVGARGVLHVTLEGARADDGATRAGTLQPQPDPACDRSAALIASHLRRAHAHDPQARDPDAAHLVRALALAQAALLSTRTGEGERPDALRRMVG